MGLDTMKSHIFGLMPLRKPVALVMGLGVALFGSCIASAQTFPGAGVGAIPDDAPGTPLVTSFAVSGITGNLTDLSVSVTFNPAHTWGGDVTATLKAPGGTPSFPLFGRIGSTTAGGVGDSSDLAGPYVFVDPATAGSTDIWTAAGAVAGAAPIAAGTYFTGPVGGAGVINPPGGTAFAAAFAGLTPAQSNGTWTLEFTDSAAGDTGSVSAVDLTLVAAAADVAPVFGYSPAPTGTVGFVGGGSVGSMATGTITVSVATPGTGAATTTTTCVAPTAPFSGFGQVVTAVGAGAISGGPLSGDCTLGATLVTQTLVCTEDQGGTLVPQTFELSCPAGTAAPPAVAVPVPALSDRSLAALAALALLLGLFTLGWQARRH